ncbi:ParB-like partition protein [Polaromonas sp. CF318]|uniref:ParB/RepB/Spo0J family partition protein n=1 Tax=Polaromonas sp. CF318 TaxID=1144318 RepID=UPI0002710F9D|nr:ParB/RepB/Spo0J family partition protein [Polaromonas sp. CF318]EJL90453.1 ParB-like partition protein [Polaromonas sp. CF318]
MTNAVATTESFARMAHNLLVPSLTNRKPLPLAKLQAMADTMRNGRGVRQALIVRVLPPERLHDTKLNTPKGQPLPTHEIVCGEQRWHAGALAALQDVPVIIRKLTDAEALEEQVIENVQRQDYTEFEEGEAFQRLMQHNHLTADEVAAKVGRSRRHVFNRMKLLDLRAETRTALTAGEIDATRALLLARIPDHEQQLKALPMLAKRDFHGDYELSSARASELIQRDFMLNLSGAPFKCTDETLVPEAGNCKTCTKRTGHNPDLFADVKGADICTDPPCYHRKEAAHHNRVLEQAHANGQEVITGREAKALMPNSFGGIEGYLRLDDAKDSPTDKPLRKLLGNILERDEVKTTLVENPHNKGEMIAVLPAAKVAELLKARGHKAAASALEAEEEGTSRAQAEAAKEAKKLAFEQGWRDELLNRTYAKLCEAAPIEFQVISDDVLRIIARHLVDRANGERTRQLCELLALGKIAPRQALNDYILACADPERVVLLLVMHADVEFKDFMADPTAANRGLLQVASEYGVDVQEAKDATKKAIRASEKTPTPAASPSKGEGGGQDQKRKTSRKPKISAEQATQGIASAMQNLEEKAAVPAAAPPAVQQPTTTKTASKPGKGQEPAAPAAGGEVDPLQQQAAQLVITQQKATVRLLKTELGIGTTKALEVMAWLEAQGTVSTCDERGVRKVLVAV